EIHHGLHAPVPSIADDAAGTQRTRTEFHPPFKPSDDLTRSEFGSHAFAQLFIIFNCRVRRSSLNQECLDLRIGERRTEVATLHGTVSPRTDTGFSFELIPSR